MKKYSIIFTFNRENKLKRILISLLCFSVLLSGCYSYYSISDEGFKGELPSPDENIRINLKNDTVIETKLFHHIYLSEASNLIFAKGRVIKYAGNINKSFEGWVKIPEVDSLKYYDNSGLKWLRTGEVIYQFENIEIEKKNTNGFWINGTEISNKNELKYLGAISLNDIKNIECKEFDLLKTSALIITSSLFIALILSGGLFTSIGPIKINPF
jgi:hypothetical protein